MPDSPRPVRRGPGSRQPAARQSPGTGATVAGERRRAARRRVPGWSSRSGTASSRRDGGGRHASAVRVDRGTGVGGGRHQVEGDADRAGDAPPGRRRRPRPRRPRCRARCRLGRGRAPSAGRSARRPTSSGARHSTARSQRSGTSWLSGWRGASGRRCCRTISTTRASWSTGRQPAVDHRGELAVGLAHPHLELGRVDGLAGRRVAVDDAGHLEAVDLAPDHAALDHDLEPGVDEQVDQVGGRRRGGGGRRGGAGSAGTSDGAVDGPHRRAPAANSPAWRASRPAASRPGSARRWRSSTPLAVGPGQGGTERPVGGAVGQHPTGARRRLAVARGRGAHGARCGRAVGLAATRVAVARTRPPAFGRAPAPGDQARQLGAVERGPALDVDGRPRPSGLTGVTRRRADCRS